MQRWKLILSYDGTSYNGWQIQPHLPTIQGTLAAALQHLTGETVLPQGSGRTDAGVHALAQVASFDLAAPIPECNLVRALNHTLPPAIRVFSACHAAATFHARHSAISKTYEYRIFPRSGLGDGLDRDRICCPMLAPYVWDCPWPLSLEAAQQAEAHVLGQHDFTSFAAIDPDRIARNSGTPPSNARTIYQSSWRLEGGIFHYRVTGSGFLHHMVRNLVGTFIDVAAERIAPGSIPRILAARNRAAASPTAPARGLFLDHVTYAAEEGNQR